VDSVIDFPGFPGLPEVEPDVPAFLELVSLLRTRSYDVAIQLHGNGPISNSIVAMFGARYTAGLATADAWRPSPGSYLEPPAAAHEIHRCLGLVSTLGCDTDDRLEFPITADDIASTHRPGFPGNGRFVCIHAGSAAPARRWPVARFAAVANHLSGLSYRVVLTGTAAERDLTAELANRLRVPVLDLAGRTSLGAMAALLKASALLVCNDTGVSHLAAAVGARAVVVSSDHEPWRWAPLHTSRITTLTSDPASPLAAAAVIAAADDHLGISSTPGAVA
jgi:ADP-heptose:LPS heptosyltransferase